METRSTTSTVIDVGCSRKHNFRQEENALRKGTTITKGPPKRPSDAKIIDMLDKLTPDLKKPRYFKGYRETHNWTHKCAL
jgi:hypothetical protein